MLKNFYPLNLNVIIFGILVSGFSAIHTNTSFAQSSIHQDLALVGAKIYPSPSAKAIINGIVLIRNGKITAIGNRKRFQVPKNTKVINCRGLVLTAGFWNCHVHFIEPKWQHADSIPASQLTEQMEDMITSHGFVHVFELATLDLRNLLSLRERIKKGEVRGPEIFTTGVPFAPPGGSPVYIEPLKLPEIGTAGEAVAFVKKQIDSGADAIKFWSASPVHGRIVNMPVDVAKAAVAAAHKSGKLVFTHPTNNAGVNIAIESGVDIIAHVDQTTGRDGIVKPSKACWQATYR